MQRIFLIKWVFRAFIFVLQFHTLRAAVLKNALTTNKDKDTQETVDWTGLITDLRDSWQSPLSYLEKRGYLPPGNENLLEEKLNELRGMKVEVADEKLSGNAADEASISAASSNTNVEAETDNLNMKCAIAHEIIPNAISTNSVDAIAVDDATATLSANSDHEIVDNLATKSERNAQYSAQFDGTKEEETPIITYASQQQLTNEQQEDLFKGLTSDLNANVDRRCEGDLKSLKNDLANNNKTTNATQTKTKTKKKKAKAKSKKCKSRSKSQKSKEAKAEPGFFKRLKQKFTSMFKKSNNAGADFKNDNTAAVARLSQTKDQKLDLSPDFANYYVTYLADKDNVAYPETNSLSVNYYGDNELEGDKSLYRRAYSDKGLLFKDTEIKDATHIACDKEGEAFSNLATNDAKTPQTGAKDFSIGGLLFNDFNLGVIDVKSLETKNTTSAEEVKMSDLKNFDSKDNELNRIVHSLAEQQQQTTGAKKDDDWKSLQSGRYTTQDELALPLKGSSSSEAVDELNLADMDAKSFTDTPSKLSASSSMEFGDLAMPRFKMKALEAKARNAALSKYHQQDSNEFALNEINGASFRDFGVNDVLAKESSYAMRELRAHDHLAEGNNGELDDKEKYDNDSDRGDDDHANGDRVVVFNELGNLNNFDWLSSSQRSSDKTALDLDREFTRQVLEKAMHNSARNKEEGDKE